MPILFSPIDGQEWRGAFRPYPRSAFLMFHDNENVSKLEERMIIDVRSSLDGLGIQHHAASSIRRTGDFLSKILHLIQGCGFGVAIYSDVTPARTLANIFFEVGVCQIVGKPVHLVVSGDNPTPSDFVRNEWIRLVPGKEKTFQRNLQEAFSEMVSLGDYYCHLGEIALSAEETDYELAFERFKQAVLLNGSSTARAALSKIQTNLRASRPQGKGGTSYAAHRRRLLQSIDEFVRLLAT